MIFEEKQKTHPIDRKQVWEAFKHVRASGGSAGVDGMTIDDVDGKFRRSDMHGVFRTLNFRLARWIRNRYRRFRPYNWYFAYKWLVEVSKKFPTLFVHWDYGFRP